jgi:hypothetical protein
MIVPNPCLNLVLPHSRCRESAGLDTREGRLLSFAMIPVKAIRAERTSAARTESTSGNSDGSACIKSSNSLNSTKFTSAPTQAIALSVYGSFVTTAGTPRIEACANREVHYLCAILAFHYK